MFKSFQIKVLFYLGVLFLALSAMAYIMVNGEHNFALVILIPLLIGLVWSLFNLVNKTNKDYSQFLLGIKYNDF